jgi:hypothetical protein
MASDVDAISLVIEGSGNTPKVIAHFNDDRLYVGAREQFVGRSQACWTRTNDDGGLRLVHTRFNEESGSSGNLLPIVT